MSSVLPMSDLVRLRPSRDGRAAQAIRPFASVEVHRDAGAILADWADLETEAPCSIYQTRRWLLPWTATMGARSGLSPYFVVARDAAGSAVALLALGTRRIGPVTVATWLGGKDANIKLALIRQETNWRAEDLADLMRRAAACRDGPRPDVFLFPGQPLEWRGIANPLSRLPHRPSPSAAFGTRLPADAEAFFADKLSKDARKKLRKKEAKLATAGSLTHRIARTGAEQAAILDRFVALKLARFQALGIVSEFAAPEMRAFLEAASAPNGSGIELHALCCGERIVAIYGGASHGGQWSGMVNAFDADEEIARSSPGDLLLHRIVAQAIANGLDRFDLGVGEARYKASLCDEPIALVDAMIPISLTGRLYAQLFAAGQRAKRVAKANPRFFALAKVVRRRLGR